MANGNRDVKMTLSVETLGVDEIKNLQSRVEALAKGAGDAAPEFEALASEIGKLGEQAAALRNFEALRDKTLALEQSQRELSQTADATGKKLQELAAKTAEASREQEDAKGKWLAAKNAVREVDNSIKSLNDTYKGAGRSAKEYKDGVAELRQEKLKALADLDKEQLALKEANSELREAEVVQKRATAAYERTSAAVDESSKALGRQKSELADAAKAVDALGLSSSDVAKSQATLVSALNDTGKSAQEVKTRLDAIAAADAELDRQNQEIAAKLRDRMAATQAVYEREEAAAKAAAEAVKKAEAEKTAAVEAAAEAVKKAEAEKTAAAKAGMDEHTRLAELQERTLAAMRSRAHDERMGIERDYAAMVEKAAAERVAAEKRVQEQSDKTAREIQGAFSTLGVRSAKDIAAEIERVKEAMERVQRESGQTGAALATAMSAGRDRIKELERELREVNDQLTAGDKAADLFKNSMGQIAAGNLIADGIGYIIGKVKELASAFVQVNIQAESMRRGLTAIYGSAEVAGEQMKALSGIATTAGVSVAGISDAFIRFSAATRSSNIPLEQSNALFKAVVTASATLGMGTEQTTRAIEALGQMASKGVVSMEELRQQLGDALPGALSRAAQGMGLTDAELIKLVESGQLATRDFFPGLTKGLQSLQGETDGIAQSWGRFKTALTTAATSVGDAGFVTILSAAIKALGVVILAVIGPIQVFFDSLMLIPKALGIVAGAISSGDYKNAFGALREEFDNVNKRAMQTASSFIAMVDPSSDAAKALQEVGGSAKVAGQESKLSASQIEELAKGYEKAATEALEMSGGSTAVAAANRIMADSTVDLSSKYSQLTITLGKLQDEQKKQVELAEIELKSAKHQAESIKTIADLRGEEAVSLDASAEGSKLVTEAAEKEVKAREQLAASLAVELQAKTELARTEAGGIEARKEVLSQLAQRLAKAKEEAEASKSELEGLRATSDALDLKRKKYEDNSAAVEAFKKAMLDANAALAEAQKKYNAGKISSDEFSAAQTKAASAAALFKDALEDQAKAIDRNVKSKLADNSMAQAALAMSLELAKEQMATSKRIGDEVGYRQALIRQKEIEIQIDKLKIEAQKLEADGSIALTRAKMAELNVSDPLYKSKKAEYETTIKLAEVKLKLVDVQRLGIDYREREMERIRSGAQALDVENGKLDSNTTSRNDNSRAIDNNTSARERALSVAEKELDLKEREEALARKKAGVDKDGFTVDKSGQRVSVVVETRMSIENALKGYGVDEAGAKRIASEFTDLSGNVPYFDNPGQLRYAGRGGSMSLAVQKAAEQWLNRTVLPNDSRKFDKSGNFVGSKDFGLNDTVSIEASTKSKLADNTIAQYQAEYNLEVAKSRTDSAKRIGDEAVYQQSLNQQREIELALDKLKLEAIRLETEGRLSLAKAKLVELDASDSLYTSKKMEYEADIKLAEAKLRSLERQSETLNVRAQKSNVNLGFPAQSQPYSQPQSAATSSSRTVNIVINGRPTSVNVTSDTDADKLESLLKSLASQAGVAA